MSVHFKAIVSSDWNECLAPCRPFDCIAFNFPEVESDLTTVFKQFTNNQISLGEAAGKIQKLLPDSLTPDQMDAYLDKSFATFVGVPELIEWCLSNDILFMINTTGLIGYFQRIFAKGLLPRVPVLSAHPMLRYPKKASDPSYVYELCETWDKGSHTEAVARLMDIRAEKIILLGDSGGDGPHFEWGAAAGAFLISSMIKPSLDNYCRDKGIAINLRFGLDYTQGCGQDTQKELQIDFMNLTTTIEEIVNQ